MTAVVELAHGGFDPLEADGGGLFGQGEGAANGELPTKPRCHLEISGMLPGSEVIYGTSNT